MIGEHLRELSQVIELFIPYDRGDVLAKAHREGQVLEEIPEEKGWKVSARLEKSSVGRLEEFMRG
jgi:GTP-binding protein HflX